ncbi:acyl-CoA dehydrogenase [Roseateles sp. YR242]|uniref:acyl-CoA dehydrogenase family protein n=1 Tax=Roseateles sp. YR242 TaxID=1855305 RepID=UPI0008B8764E|nr:acyl-CoA dehydrogenase family protein [Roseateles sp. YR242]SEL23111.1 acyl-CoA dehydrogenase [Roseateles sp. YR242]
MILTHEDAAFRDEVRAFLDEALTPDLRAAGRRCSGIFSDYPDGIRWHRRLAERGWSVPHWPVAHGGTGWSPLRHYLFASELAAADAPPLAPMGTHMVGPVIIAFGTPEQQRRWLPGIRSGSDYWAQGYSEPQAGSDLASLQCKAVRLAGVKGNGDGSGEGSAEGDVYVVNGSKIWNTHAHHANRMFLLVRTAGGGRPQAGISFLCLDLQQPGVTVRPIRSISGDHELNQVFFDDVRVPVSGLIGEENQGWAIAKFLLQHERGSAWAPLLRARLQRLKRALGDAFAASAAPSPEREELRTRLADLACQVDAVQAMELRALAAQQRGEPAGVRPSIGKLLGSETRQRITELGLDIAAHYGQVKLPMEEADAGVDAGVEAGADEAMHGEALARVLGVPEASVFAMSAYLNDRAASIYAGTNEVQRNIVAAHLLAGH